MRVAVYDAAPKPAAPTGQFEHVDYSRLSDIIVWLQPVDKMDAPLREACTLDIDPGKPSTDVHAASVGQTIVLRNTSSSPVTFYSVSDGNDFTAESIAPGASGKFTAHAEGLIEILANPAKPPVALVYAAPSTWVARAHGGQTVTFNNVPPGKYQAVSWHPRLPGTQNDITLTSGQVTRTALSVGVTNLSKTPG